MTDIIWNKKAKKFVQKLDIKTKREIGALLLLLQRGKTLGPPQSKPMKDIDSLAYELRINDRKGIYRIIYILNFRGNIYIPHVFQKKTQKTSKQDIETAKKRLREFLNESK